MVLLHCELNLNSLRLAPEYAESRYLFRQGRGDCPAGCTENDFWYFKVTGNQVTYLGHWRRLAPLPDWWDEAQELIDRYRLRGLDPG